MISTLVVVWVILAECLPVNWPTWSTPVVLTTTIIVIGAVPISRRFVIRHVWCVYSRHRVRKCFVQSRVMTHEGLLPLFMWTRPTAVGERLWLWLRPGLSGRDIENVADRLAAACWASSARVTVSAKRASVVTVDIIRRDPLAGTDGITSPLLDGVHRDHFESDTEMARLPDRSTVTPASTLVEGTTPGDSSSAESVVARVGTTKRTSTRTTPRAENKDSSTLGVVGWSGREDVSDYV